jgi:hypothetical protein
MQLSSVDPRINPIAPAVKENIFAFGDCCLTSLNEIKGVVSILFLVPYISKNLQQMAHN